MIRSTCRCNGALAAAVRTTLLTSVLGTWAALGALVAEAESPAEAPAEAAGEDNILSEVVVHARKREESAVEVPLAISTVSAEQLQQNSVQRLTDIGRVVPNVAIHPSGDGGGTVQTIIRGQTSSIAYFAVDPAVGYYFDGVYVAEGRGLATGIFDISSVEVSRGVQGTLNGRNNTGGAISFYSTPPQLGQYSLDTRLGAGNFGSLNSFVAANIPIGSSAAVRMDFNQQYRGPAARSIVNGQGYDAVDQYAWRVSALFVPTDNFTSTLIYEGSHMLAPTIAVRSASNTLAYRDQLLGSNANRLDPSHTVYTASQLLPPDFYQTAQNSTQKDKVNTNFFRGNATYNINDALTAKVIAGYRSMSSRSGLDVDGTPELITQAFNFGGDSRQLTVEPQLLGTFERLSTVIGYFYFNDNGTYQSNLLPAAAPTVIREHGRNLSDAGYAHAEYGLTDKWKVAAGARYTKDVREVGQDQFTAGGGLFNFGKYNLQKSFNYWSYQATTDYDINQSWHLYARTGKGQRSGGYSLPIQSPVAGAIPFKPEVLTDYEIGIKTVGLLDGALSFNADYYYGDYKDIQRLLSHVVQPGLFATTIINAASATVSGVETEFNWRLAKPLTLSGFATYTDAHYNRFPYQPTAASGVIDLRNQPFYATPQWMTRLAAAYEMPVSYGSWRLSVGWNWQSAESLVLISDPSATQRAYSLVDARLSWSSPDKVWDISVYGTNLAGTHYYTFGQLQGKTLPSSQPTESYFVLGDPRIYAAEITYHFGK